MTEIIANQMEHKLRGVWYCSMKPPHAGQSATANFGLALQAARLIKRQRKEIEALRDELAYHGIYPK